MNQTLAICDDMSVSKQNLGGLSHNQPHISVFLPNSNCSITGLEKLNPLFLLSAALVLAAVTPHPPFSLKVVLLQQCKSKLFC